MFLSNEAIRDYQTIYKNHFNEEISFEQARKQGEELIHLMKLICEPNDINKYKPSKLQIEKYD